MVELYKTDSMIIVLLILMTILLFYTIHVFRESEPFFFSLFTVIFGIFITFLAYYKVFIHWLAK